MKYNERVLKVLTDLPKRKLNRLEGKNIIIYRGGKYYILQDVDVDDIYRIADTDSIIIVLDI
ncbi:hypothetical protein [Thermoanaerobacterium thermosulfurigenes]|uniref:hypothetical protein n=1 Tax=Thermoanaerobacterium thermosulfurigenes TaxID=33950 RepID=UPI003EF83074